LSQDCDRNDQIILIVAARLAGIVLCPGAYISSAFASGSVVTTSELAGGENASILATVWAVFPAIFISATGFISTAVLIEMLLSNKKQS
jgi:hypothetical protein